MLKVILCLAAAAVLLFPMIARPLYTRKFMKLLEEKDYAGIEKKLDGFFVCMCFKPYNREFMRLTCRIASGDEAGTEKQVRFMLEKLKMKDEQKAVMCDKAFWFFMEQENWEMAGKVLDTEKTCSSAGNIQTKTMLYEIFGLKECRWIDTLEERIKQAGTPVNDSEKIQIGILQYMLGVQLLQQDEKQKSKVRARNILSQALENTRSTPYEPKIQTALARC